MASRREVTKQRQRRDVLAAREVEAKPNGRDSGSSAAGSSCAGNCSSGFETTTIRAGAMAGEDTTHRPIKQPARQHLRPLADTVWPAEVERVAGVLVD